jgi:hypothetical protein
LDAAEPFLDTAALLRCLDLVVAVDTAVARLAGAPVWLTLCTVVDWRWLLDRADSPGYPSMCLFRPSAVNEWEPVFARLAADLPRYAPRERGLPVVPVKS